MLAQRYSQSGEIGTQNHSGGHGGTGKPPIHAGVMQELNRYLISRHIWVLYAKECLAAPQMQPLAGTTTSPPLRQKKPCGNPVKSPRTKAKRMQTSLSQALLTRQQQNQEPILRDQPLFPRTWPSHAASSRSCFTKQRTRKMKYFHTRHTCATPVSYCLRFSCLSIPIHP